jgi:ribonuclease T1
MFQGTSVTSMASTSLARFAGKLGLASVVVLFALCGARVDARGVVDEPAQVSLSSLPIEAQQTQRLIRAGGPFPYAKDGIVFGNRERVLPRRERGFYREYTVRTPGSRDRGARRIVCGGRQPTDPEACFYSADHYASFQRIAP